MGHIKNHDLICLWCGQKTTGIKSVDTEEHIFPEAIGGKKTLYIGAVCKSCQENLCNLDNSLKKEHPSMMDSYQADENIKGKKTSNKERKERRLREKIEIQGIGETGSTKIRRANGNIDFINVNYAITSETFIRSLHKCIANILCDIYGSIEVRKKYIDLLDFVKEGGDIRPWSYALSSPFPLKRPLISEPRLINHYSIKTNNKTHEVISFIHTSGVWIVGSSPFLLNPSIIENFSSLIIKQLEHIKDPISKKPLTDFFCFEWHKEKRDYFGKLKFLWVVKEIVGKTNDDFFYILTMCKSCGQINPTMLSVPRNKLLEDKYKSGAFDLNMNTWNYTEKGIPLKLVEYIKNMNIRNCKIECINCGNGVIFSAKDCFL